MLFLNLKLECYCVTTLVKLRFPTDYIDTRILLLIC